jgi:hypothetical protein
LQSEIARKHQIERINKKINMEMMFVHLAPPVASIFRRAEVTFPNSLSDLLDFQPWPVTPQQKQYGMFCPLFILL